MNILGAVFDWVTDWIFAGVNYYMAQRSWRILLGPIAVVILFVSVMALVVTHSLLALAWVVLMAGIVLWLVVDLVRNPPDVDP